MAHKTKVCVAQYKCDGCNVIVQRNNDSHKCGFGTCTNCHQIDIDLTKHECYMTKKEGKGGYCSSNCTCNGRSRTKLKGCSYTEKYVFYDYEAQQDSCTHIPNLVIAHDFDGRKHIFPTDDNGSANDKFCKWALNEEQKGTTYIAYNAKG